MTAKKDSKNNKSASGGVNATTLNLTWIDRIEREHKASKEHTTKWAEYQAALYPESGAKLQQMSLWNPASSISYKVEKTPRPFPTTQHIVGMSSRPAPPPAPKSRYHHPATEGMEIGWVYEGSKSVLSLESKLF
ncbi:hypothetical protein SmJEL517_g04388 [Synchytrium microbalum]|uniref:Uncharacterized protein n=1 Tax=Synchytrium microbalum TaxID=1806994 RepID=A0A507C353_9FUNG|nr:uncharacterized protein SmJEL517_g04388 [Synchytrium microbalum]TPX32514.1 hypothetical protein SmJEL517_g04388 [Synchytrium microbalum]